MANNYETILVDWIKGVNPSASIDLDTDLIESAVIDSLQFAEFILLIEELANREIDVDEQVVENFKDLRTIIDVFLTEHNEMSAAV